MDRDMNFIGFLRRRVSSFPTDITITIAVTILMISTMVLSSMIFTCGD